MKIIKLTVLMLILVNSIHVSYAGTRTETYDEHREAISKAHLMGQKVFRATHSCLPDRCALECWGEGEVWCKWFVPAGGCTNGILNSGGSSSLFDIADAEALFEHGLDQVASDINSGTYNANWYVGSTTYYRSITWSYNTSTYVYDATVSITEVTP
ncbi:MAG: hypothetical protein U0Y96_03010 [Candidatus Kapaibacterium sp.]|nr:hypothetical protein [Bacteroidota bacterium]